MAPASLVTLAIPSETYPLCFSDAIAISAGSTAGVAIAAATVCDSGGGDGGVSGGGESGRERGDRCAHHNHCLRVKAAYSIRRRGSDYGGGAGGGGLAAAVMVAVEGEDVVLGCDRAGGCGAGGVAPVDAFSASIAFELICGARGDGGGGSGGG